MKPISKLNSYVFAITTSMVYILWDFFNSLSIKSPILMVIIVFVFSASFYKGVYFIVSFICNHFQLFRKMVLGKYFFEGTWIGYYNYKGEVQLTCSIYYQSIDELSIYGRSFDLKGNNISNWTIVEPYINIQKSQFSYFYEINDSENTDIYMGYANSTIIFDKHKKPCRFDGYAVDGDDSCKQFFIDIKESDSCSKYRNNQKYLFDKAYELYKNENIF